jgi:hypothetical protein
MRFSSTPRGTRASRTSRLCRRSFSARSSAAAYARNYGGTVKEIRKAARVSKAFQQVLDDPEAGAALEYPALKPLLDEAAD